MRLLLDELYSSRIADRLGARGHDVVSASGRADLAGKSDAELFAAMALEGCAILTNDSADFIPLFNRALAEGASHAGLVLTSDRSLPRSKAGIGRFVRVLERFLGEHESADALRNQIHWLP